MLDRYEQAKHQNKLRVEREVAELRASGKTDSEVITTLAEKLVDSRTSDQRGTEIMQDHDRAYQKQLARLNREYKKVHEENRRVRELLQEAGWYAPEREDENSLPFWLMGLIGSYEDVCEQLRGTKA